MIFNFCCDNQKYIIFVTGEKKDKDQFIERIFGVKTKEVSFAEYEVSYSCTNLIVQMLENDKDLKEVYDMHTKMANGIIFLSKTDEPVKTTKKSLFVYLNGKSKLESDGNVIVSSVVDDSYADVKSGFKQLLSKIKAE